MLNNKKVFTNYGIVHIVVTVVALAVIALVAAFSYYALKGRVTPSETVSEEALDEELAGISDSDEIETLEAELEATIVGSTDADIEELLQTSESL